MEHKKFDVIVIGGGLSGLTAAYELLKFRPETEVLVLEAKDRVGGRTLTSDVDISGNRQERFDLGGQWVTQTQVDIMEMLDELGLKTYPQYITGKKVMQVGAGNKIRTYTSDIPSLGSIYGLIQLQLFIWKMERMCKEVPMEDPYSSPLAEKYDKMTMETFVRENLSNEAAVECIEAACRASMGTEMARLSVLFFLAYANSAGGAMKLFLANEGCAQEMRVKGGTQQISKLLAERVGVDRVRLKEPVAKITQHGDHVVVNTCTGKSYVAGYVVVSAPPQWVARIHFDPPLPESRQLLMENMPVGHLTKFIVTYDKAYWREAGFSGEIVSNGDSTLMKGCSTGPISVVYDATTDNDVPALVGFIAGRAGVEWHSKTAAERQAAVLEGLEKCLGPWASSKAVSYTEKVWAEEPYNGGCPVSFGVPGIMYTFHTLRTPHGRIHWCGTETATHWAGYLSGAVQSGRRAALELLKEWKARVPDALEKQVRRKPVNINNPPHPLLVKLVPVISVAVGIAAYFAFKTPM